MNAREPLDTEGTHDRGNPAEGQPGRQLNAREPSDTTGTPGRGTALTGY
jgi:hypothetical protein